MVAEFSIVRRRTCKGTEMIGNSRRHGKDEMRPSSDIIVEQFRKCGTLLTISGRKIIFGETEEAAYERFATLIGELRKIERSQPFHAELQGSLIWVLHTRERKKLKKSYPNIRSLQQALHRLDDATSKWLKDRATFVVADADPSWLHDAVNSVGSFHRNGYPSLDWNAGKFFKSMSSSSWMNHEAYTAFPASSTSSDDASVDFDFFSHTDPPDDDWRHGAVGTPKKSLSKNRHGILRTICDAHRDLIGSTESSPAGHNAVPLFNAGFAIFDMNKFKRLE